MPDKQPSPSPEALRATENVSIHNTMAQDAAIIDAEFAPLRAELDKLREENKVLKKEIDGFIIRAVQEYKSVITPSTISEENAKLREENAKLRSACVKAGFYFD